MESVGGVVRRVQNLLNLISHILGAMLVAPLSAIEEFTSRPNPLSAFCLKEQIFTVTDSPSNDVDSLTSRIRHSAENHQRFVILSILDQILPDNLLSRTSDSIMVRGSLLSVWVPKD